MEYILHEYRWILFILLMFGLFPAIQNDNKLLYSYTHNVYSFAINFLIFFTITDLFLIRLQTDMQMLVFIMVSANVGIEIFLTCGYFVSALFFWQNRFVHIDFLSAIVQFDRNTTDSSTTSKQSVALEIYILIITFVVAHIGTTLVLNQFSALYEIILVCYLVVLMNIMCLMSLHMKFCSDLLNHRFEIIRSQFAVIEQTPRLFADRRATDCASLIQRFIGLWQLRSKFQKLFSQILVATMLNDQFQMAYCTFMQTLAVAGERKFNIGHIFPILSYFLFPVLRKSLVVRSVNRLAHQVSEDINSFENIVLFFFFFNQLIIFYTIGGTIASNYRTNIVARRRSTTNHGKIEFKCLQTKCFKNI